MFLVLNSIIAFVHSVKNLIKELPKTQTLRNARIGHLKLMRKTFSSLVSRNIETRVASPNGNMPSRPWLKRNADEEFLLLQCQDKLNSNTFVSIAIVPFLNWKCMNSNSSCMLMWGG